MLMIYQSKETIEATKTMSHFLCFKKIPAAIKIARLASGKLKDVNS